jgi:hypothetical protein
MARVFYRVGQFLRGLSARIEPQEQRRVAEALPSSALFLFTQMPLDAQRHSLNVWESVQAAGYEHPDLTVAALLHDCGKVAAAQGGVKLGLWLRGPLVLLEALAPRLVARRASPNPAHSWRYAMYVQAAHPSIGALWAAEAGCSALSCWLIAHHQTPLSKIGDGLVNGGEARTLLIALQQADNGN